MAISRLSGRNWQLKVTLCSSALTASLLFGTGAFGGAVDPVAAVPTATPIKRVIILIGENRGLDHMFGTYTPKGAGQTISNLLSKGIVKADGSPGPNYALAQQYSVAAQPLFYVGAPDNAKFPYNNTTNPMPQPTTGGAPTGPNGFYPYTAGYSPPMYPSCNPSDPGAADQSQGCDSNWTLAAQQMASEVPDILASQYWEVSSGWTDLAQ